MIKAVIFDCFGVVLTVHSERNQPVIDFIASLRPTYKVGMLSNVSSWKQLDARFEPNELLELFDDVVASGDFMMEKPDPAIYQLAADRLGVDPQECLFVDDIERFCVAAEQAGMTALHCEDIETTITAIQKILKEKS
jgi:putative hydrolase of the HAD superfamily